MCHSKKIFVFFVNLINQTIRAGARAAALCLVESRPVENEITTAASNFIKIRKYIGAISVRTFYWQFGILLLCGRIWWV